MPPTAKAVQAAVAVVAQCGVVRHREARLLRPRSEASWCLCPPPPGRGAALSPPPRRPPVRQGQGGPVGAVRQALLRRAGLAGHQGPPSRAAHSTRSRAARPGRLAEAPIRARNRSFNPRSLRRTGWSGAGRPTGTKESRAAPYLRRHSPSRPASTAASQAISISRSAARRSSQTRG